MKVKVTIEETLRKDFDVEVPDLVDDKFKLAFAMDVAKEKYRNGEFILDGDAYVVDRMMRAKSDKELVDLFVDVPSLYPRNNIGENSFNIEHTKLSNKKGERKMNLITKIRKTITIASDIRFGDQIEFELKGFGTFTATAQQITPRGIMFLMDDCVAKHRMNEQWTNEGGYEKSEMCKWINEELTPAFKETFGEHFIEVTLPTYGQMFSHDEWYEKAIEPDNDEQFPLMKKRKNRVADFKDDYCWYWLKNATKKSFSSETFAFVDCYGSASSNLANVGYGVRPVFLIK